MSPELRRSDGKIVIVGGRSSVSDGVYVNTVEIFDPETKSVSCPFDQGNCGINDTGLLPAGRLAPIVTVDDSDNIIVAMGETTDEKCSHTTRGWCFHSLPMAVR